jgi:Complex I intermediate-associated protein 30 (CIA30)
MKVLKIAKWLTIGTIAAVLAACGGGGGSSDTLPPRSQLDIAGIKIGSYSYSEAGPMGAVKISVADRLDIFESVIPALAAGNTFAGYGAILTLPSDIKSGFSTAEAVEINLAAEASPSAGATRTIKVQLKKTGAAANGCLPTAEVQVPSTQMRFVLALTAAQFPLPSFCSGPTASNPVIAGVVVDIEAIQVEDGNIAATAVNSKISIGRFAFTSAPSVVVPPPPVDTAPGTLVASFSTAAGINTTVQGGAISGGFSFAQNGANLTSPVRTIEGGNLLQWSSNLTGDQGGFSGSASQFAPSVTNWSTASQVSLLVSSDQSSYQFRVVLKGGASANGCEYLQNMPAGSVSNTLQTVTLALSGFTADPFGGCSTDPGLAVVLTDVAEIRVIDTSWNFASTGARTSLNRVGDVRISQ